MKTFLLSILLFLPICATAQKHSISPEEQAHIIEVQRGSYTSLYSEGDTVTFRAIFELPDATESVIYNRCIEALQQHFHVNIIGRTEDNDLHRVFINGHMLRNNTIVKNGVAVGNYEIQQYVDVALLVQVKPGRCRITLSFSDLCVDAGNTASWFHIGTFYPIDTTVKPENRLTSWSNISWAYDAAQQVIAKVARTMASSIYDDQW